ncbi:hypothetical protein BT96DRAFT_912986 [Gymnopus androsaceus JB14]|uniref:Uncharacterized protein n=1 Tax=Gymnopus androsaceus JB14 TaxID=1447944 RepID=A0A6A4IKN8_9AGAR|nr:hypothetical protein BT96DRAFT_912986 [Gymnopus androsaceus JB14]
MAEDDEDIDAETLQAQIDLSLSVANNLVSSWMKPSNKPKTPYNQNLEAELKEHMRRPPRLGVGASIPESTSVSSRETARLKGHLAVKGVKRAREEEGSSSNKQLSDEEEESRAGAIRKKTISNPFAMPASKKKKVAQSDTIPPLGDDNTQPIAMAASPNDIRRKSKGKKTDRGLSPSHNDLSGDPAAEMQEIPIKTVAARSPEQSHRPGPGTSSSSDVVGHSVLNLNGPVVENDSDADSAAGSPSKSKKKRKRRKKKKKNLNVGTESKETS